MTVNGVTIVNAGGFVAGQTVDTAAGLLSITGFTPTFAANGTTIVGGTVSYSYVLQDNTLLHTGANDGSLTESFSAVLQDADGSTDTASLDIQIIDDTPVANDDVASLTEGGPIAVTIDVDTNDVAGADGTLSRAFTSLTGTYGTITLNADGTQTYTLSASGQAAIDALAPGATLTDTFNYTLTDGDGDSDPATLTVTLNGSDDPVVITGLGRTGAKEIVDEDDLVDGSSPNAAALTQTGTFTIDAPDGLGSLTVNGVTIVNAGGFVAGQTVDTAAGLLSITGFTPVFAPNGTTIVGGTIDYSYVLQDNTLLHTGG